MPTILYFLMLPIAEQIVDIPVPGGGGRLAGLQGFLPGQNSTAREGPRAGDCESAAECQLIRAERSSNGSI